MTARATAALADLETPTDARASFRAALDQAARRCGFAHAAYMHLGYRLTDVPAKAPGLLVSSGGLNETLYGGRGYLAYDPLAARAAAAFAPFAWSLEDLADPAARPLARAFDAWGVRSGLIAPIHDSTAGPALVNFFGPEPALASIDAELRDGRALLAAARLHAAAKAELTVAGLADGALNAREMQVLRLAARGLTEMETAIELKLSRRGVQFHLSRAGAKLDTPNKTAAVARAITLGFLTA